MTNRIIRIDAPHIRSRLAGTRMPDDPALPVFPADSYRWPQTFVEKASKGLTPAGVLIPIFERESGMTVLLTQRSAELKLHAGQVSFPGGRMESSDADIAVTALRETHEEVGIPPESVDIAGYLHPSPTVTGYTVTPVVGLVSAEVPVVIDTSEVEAAFEVPLEFLLEKGSQQHSVREFEGVEIPIIEFNYERQRIWGATASMLLELRKILLKQ